MAFAILRSQCLLGLFWEAGLGRPQTASMLSPELGVISVCSSSLSRVLGADHASVHGSHRWSMRRDPPQPRRPAHHRKRTKAPVTKAPVTRRRLHNNGVAPTQRPRRRIRPPHARAPAAVSQRPRVRPQRV